MLHQARHYTVRYVMKVRVDVLLFRVVAARGGSIFGRRATGGTLGGGVMLCMSPSAAGSCRNEIDASDGAETTITLLIEWRFSYGDAG